MPKSYVHPKQKPFDNSKEVSVSDIFSHNENLKYDGTKRDLYKSHIYYNQFSLINFKSCVHEFRDQLELSPYQFSLLQENYLEKQDIVCLDLGDFIYEIGLSDH